MSGWVREICTLHPTPRSAHESANLEVLGVHRSRLFRLSRPTSMAGSVLVLVQKKFQYLRPVEFHGPHDHRATGVADDVQVVASQLL